VRDASELRGGRVLHNGKLGSAQNSSLYEGLGALTCSGAGDCTLGGDSQASVIPSVLVAGVVTETDGKWGRVVSPTGGITEPGSAFTVNSASCSSAGYCAAGGTTGDGAGAYIVSEWHGAWSGEILPAGIRGTTATVNAVACPPKVDLCIAGGGYPGPKGGQLAFVVGPTR
jgi:hypothetical protein